MPRDASPHPGVWTQPFPRRTGDGRSAPHRGRRHVHVRRPSTPSAFPMRVRVPSLGPGWCPPPRPGYRGMPVPAAGGERGRRPGALCCGVARRLSHSDNVDTPPRRPPPSARGGNPPPPQGWCLAAGRYPCEVARTRVKSNRVNVASGLRVFDDLDIIQPCSTTYHHTRHTGIRNLPIHRQLCWDANTWHGLDQRRQRTTTGSPTRERAHRTRQKQIARHDTTRN